MNTIRQGYIRPLDIKNGRVDLSHGSGGRAMAQLIEELFAKHLGNEYLAQGPLYSSRRYAARKGTAQRQILALYFP